MKKGLKLLKIILDIDRFTHLGITYIVGNMDRLQPGDSFSAQVLLNLAHESGVATR